VSSRCFLLLWEGKRAMIWGNSLDILAESASPKGPSSHEAGCDEGVSALELTGTLGQFIKAKLYLRHHCVLTQQGLLSAAFLRLQSKGKQNTHLVTCICIYFHTFFSYFIPHSSLYICCSIGIFDSLYWGMPIVHLYSS